MLKFNYSDFSAKFTTLKTLKTKSANQIVPIITNTKDFFVTKRASTIFFTTKTHTIDYTCMCNTCKAFSFHSIIDNMDHCFCLIILTILIAEHPGIISVFCTFSIYNLLPSTVWTVVQCPAILTALIRCLVH